MCILKIGRIAVKDHPVPKVGDDEILVKTVAVSLNPTDWMRMSSPVAQYFEAKY